MDGNSLPNPYPKPKYRKGEVLNAVNGKSPRKYPSARLYGLEPVPFKNGSSAARYSRLQPEDRSIRAWLLN
jgi:hypothetical protein